MNKQQKVAYIAKMTGIPQATVLAVLNADIAVIRAALEAGQQVRTMHLGTFKVVEYAPRMRNNFKTGKPEQVPASRVVRFTASDELKKSLNAQT